MRRLILPALALLTSGCWTPAPGQVDPTRYPWDRRNLPAPLPPPPPPYGRIEARGLSSPSPSWTTPAPHPVPNPPATGEYCVIALEAPASSGINKTGGQAMGVACSSPDPLSNPRPAAPQER
jgi:hypothetical protein